MRVIVLCVYVNGISMCMCMFMCMGLVKKSNTSGPLSTKKTPSCWYRDSHYKPETVVRPSEVYNGDSYTRKTASF